MALVGSSGAGKTTLLATLAGLVTPTEGRVTVLGTDLGRDLGRGSDRRQHRRRVGFVGQQLDLVLPLRVIHNVNAGRLGWWSTATALWSLVAPRQREEVAAILDQVGLADRLLSRTDELSGGERQRVAVARVLRQQPELVLGDEPTSSVDPRRADEVMALLVGNPVATTVVSVHDPELARRHATRLIGLRAGRVAFDDRPDAIGEAQLVELYR